MTMIINSIVFPMDFSVIGATALPHVRELAAKFGAEIQCIYVVQ
jgi:hypothetical protein